ncbi:MAG TPA: DUF2066 domain-containing protein [Woeseiaceae bacterium]|nr:DUF2066 domain-containing protein [Woeseiaceae bacterium]
MLNFRHVELLRHPLICAVAALLFTLVPGYSAVAVEVPTLYTAQVPWDRIADGSREEAYKTALKEVLARVSGSELSEDEDSINALFPRPQDYVTQYRPDAEDTLWVTFDGQAIERVLRSSGETVWGRDRPLTLIWLAVDWGQGDREIIAAGEPERTQQEGRSIDRNRLLRERLLEIARKRGLPVLFPLLDTTDLQGVSFSDIWGGFDDRIVDASRRYDADSILIGRIRSTGSQLNRWTYRFGPETRTWSGPPEMVIARIADLLAAEFAVGGNAPLETLVLNVSGIQSVDAYGSAQAMLSGLSLIESFKITAVFGDVVSYEIEVRGGAERLRRALRFAGLLEAETGPEMPGFDTTPTLEFFYETRDSSTRPSNVF